MLENINTIEYAIEIKGVNKELDGNLILDNINLKVKKGEIYGFLGANGAGKSTLMKVIYRIYLPDTGVVKLLGEEIIDGNNQVFGKTGNIIEKPPFYLEFDAIKNLKLHCSYMNIGTERIEEVLELVGLKDAGHKQVKKFSLGMKQRLALARALISSPEILILDEPINGLDPGGISEVRDLLIKVNKKEGTTIFISSHILEEVGKIADVIGIIDQGRLLAEESMSVISKQYTGLEAYYIETIKRKGA